jgi:peptide/nickel transport system ATP-binding protein/oligopeptide transport system ATP-binding protein
MPYTAGLMGSVPRLGSSRGARGRLATIPGQVPQLGRLPGGCRFRPRCGHALAACETTDPALLRGADGREVRCIRADDLQPGMEPAG